MKVFYSKTGFEIALTVLISICGMLPVILLINLWLGLIILIIEMLFIAYIIKTTHYTINNDLLEIKCGFLFKKKIKISTIVSIKESRNPLSAPALSLDRIEIKYNNYDYILLSPKDKTGFTSTLLQINPSIQVHSKI